uniref:Calcineurin subunit B isoform 1 n=1 Tax=Acartia pacifica TaxID=335913 RepID=A0A0U2IG30_ACAPC|nr:calcineurin subunit B isoform 1 [Acartia pacifica]
MGNRNSFQSDGVEGFSTDEVARLQKRFKKLDLDHSGSISTNELLSLPELKDNPLVKRVVAIFDRDNSGEIDFKEFVEGLAMFVVKSTEREQKLKFLFSVYDLDGDGLIANDELFTVLKMMVGSNLKDTQLQQMVDKTINALDKDEDGKINFEEFCGIIEKSFPNDKITTALSIDVPNV